MKPPLSYGVLLGAGILVGYGLSFVVRVHERNAAEHERGAWQWKERERIVAERWEVAGPRAVAAYFQSSIRVPIPPNLDFSTNTWQRLNYWNHFTRNFIRFQSPLGFELRSLVAPAPPDNPWEAIPNFEGREPSYLAMEALKKLRNGEDFESVTSWVATNVTYESSKEFELYMRTLIAAGKDSQPIGSGNTGTGPRL